MNAIKSTCLCTALLLGGFSVGCSQDKPTPMAASEVMTPDQMISKGNDMVQMGQRMKDHAAAMKDGDMMDGMSKGDMMTKGDKMMNDGMMLKQKGMDVKAHGN